MPNYRSVYRHLLFSLFGSCYGQHMLYLDWNQESKEMHRFGTSAIFLGSAVDCIQVFNAPATLRDIA
jgi:hypothetical protein